MRSGGGAMAGDAKVTGEEDSLSINLAAVCLTVLSGLSSTKTKTKSNDAEYL